MRGSLDYARSLQLSPETKQTWSASLHGACFIEISLHQIYGARVIEISLHQIPLL